MLLKLRPQKPIFSFFKMFRYGKLATYYLTPHMSLSKVKTNNFNITSKIICFQMPEVIFVFISPSLPPGYYLVGHLQFSECNWRLYLCGCSWVLAMWEKYVCKFPNILIDLFICRYPYFNSQINASFEINASSSHVFC